MERPAPDGADAQRVGVPRRPERKQRLLEVAQIALVERVPPAERHRQPVRDDGISSGEPGQRRGLSTAAAHVVLGRDLEEVDRHAFVAGSGGALDDVVEELPPQAQSHAADGRERHKIFLALPAHVPAPQLASPLGAAFAAGFFLATGLGVALAALADAADGGDAADAGASAAVGAVAGVVMAAALPSGPGAGGAGGAPALRRL